MFEDVEGFQWDAGNNGKSWLKHNVSDAEAEEVFFHEPLLISGDIKHSGKEKRYYGLGQTDEARKLFLAFTIRSNKIRIISVRDMNRKERAAYEKETKENTSIPQ